MKSIIFNKKTMGALSELSNEINDLYGFVKEKGSNFEEPAINSGPCGPFADIFYNIWNKLFIEKVSIVFIFDKTNNECWHILIRLPNNKLFDGGYGIHDESMYNSVKYQIKDMKLYDRKILDEHAYGLDRKYPRFCPDFSKEKVREIIEKHLYAMSEK